MNNVVFFDGVCNLCSGTVQKLIELDKNDVLKFGSLQSSKGQELLKENQLSPTDFDSILYYKNGNLLDKSDAILAIMKDLGGVWRYLSIFKIIPRFLRDRVYLTISRNRYKWFGKQESCWMPNPELKKKFIS
ncbi:DUF393 domain-containing protein [Flavobacteriaceae bacterium Ap0902]|nr:DUF393 domain-containing protein [Flavobacteriaceae bacterium Ap0902]